MPKGCFWHARLLVALLLLCVVSFGKCAPADEVQLRAALSALEGHVNGSAPLSGVQIAGHKQTIDTYQSFIGNSSQTINTSFDLVEAYETAHGSMWSQDWLNARGYSNGFTRNNTSNEDIHWTMFHVMQYIVDDTYNASNVNSLGGILNQKRFGSADIIPGPVNTTANPSTSFSVQIDGSFLNTYGRNTMHWSEPDRNARNATGAYLVAGEIATVTVPSSLVDSGYKIRVGGQSWDLSNKNPVDRLDRVSLVYDITSTSMQIASPLGGNIYIETPFEGNAGVVNVDFANVARAPFFSAQDHNTTTLSQWQNTERNYAAPWTDFQSEKFMMTVPTGWVYALDDPVTLMENWDKALDVTNDLYGFPRDRGKVTLYEAVDVRIRAGAYAPGYPTVNSTYNARRNRDSTTVGAPSNAYNGTSNHYLISGPENVPDYPFHEIGHAYLFPKLPGEVESAVNLPHVAVMNQAFGKDIQESFWTSMRGHNSYHTTDAAAVNWMTSFNFFTKREPMHRLEKQYQLKGHAKFVEVARLFGWEAINDYYRSFNEDYEALGFTPSYSIDDHLLRLSEGAGEDITPLFHFWGIHPQNTSTLQQDLAAAGVVKSRDVFELLRHYKTIVPENNAEFRQHAISWWGDVPNINGYWTQREHLRQWDENDLSDIPYREGLQYTAPLQLPNGEMYTENSAALIQAVIDDLILEYYADFLVDLNSDSTVNSADWLIFRTNLLSDMSGLTAEEAWARGDLDGDFDVDIDDFDIFRFGYETANPQPGAFAAMLAGAEVPEPRAVTLVLLCGAGLAAGRRNCVANLLN